ncbi:growth-regulated alpha protein-like isoform X3 [Etheostoma cragini]|uniref:growth-regulated alpha protein-like isoform X3 n=1 Tax=Etheostoma cragini TaxID=417921 RepID=UPI00155EDFB2|nr:growth-regulated alpha protein-like isoform X3 [Etheostoma cragini]
MSSFMKAFLLLAVMVCMSKAQQGHQSGDQCLCQRVHDRIGSKTDVKDIHIYPANPFCNKVEIVVTIKSGLRYCLNPKLKAVQKLMASIMKPKTSTTARPTELTSTPGRTNTARI